MASQRDLPQLDNPAWHSLTGAHARHARSATDAGAAAPRALRYDPEVSVWGAVPDDARPADWAALGALLAPGESIGLAGLELPEGWAGESGLGLQLIDEGFEPRPGDAPGRGASVGGPGEGSGAGSGATQGADGLVALTAADVPEMLALVERTQPGPFAPRTIELGGYVGIRVEGRLAAMAGRRLNPAGWVEISAVCTDEEYRGRGYAARLVRVVASGIRASGQRAFLHVRWDNVGAKRVYERLGFVVRREFPFSSGAPDTESGAPDTGSAALECNARAEGQTERDGAA